MNRRLRIIAPLLPLTVGLMAGIASGYFFPQPERAVLAAAVAVLVVGMVLTRFPRLQTVAIWMCTAIAGHWWAVHTVQQLRMPPRSHDLIVVSEPVSKGKTIVMDALTADGKKVRLRMMAETPAVIGSGLTVSTDVQPIGYYPLYFDSHGYSGEVFAGYRQWRGKQVSTDGLSYVQRARLRLLLYRKQLLERYRLDGLNDEAFAVTAAMTLGDKSSISTQLRETFSITGASHVLALSGLHLGILYWLVTLLTAGYRRSSLVQVITILAMWAFAFLTGLSPSIVRSAMMFSVYALLSIGHREKMSVNALAFTAIVMLIGHPLTLFDISFQLSFMAVLAILVFYPLFNSLVPLPFLQRHPVLRWMWGMTIISLSAQLGTAPLVAYHFGRIAPYALLSNFIVIPAAYAIILIALLLLVTRLALMARLLTAIVALTTTALSQMAGWPGADISSRPTLLQVSLVYIIVGCLYILLRNYAATLSIKQTYPI